jgi:hypothetical protein
LVLVREMKICTDLSEDLVFWMCRHILWEILK